MKLTEAEWAVMEALWAGESFSLGELTRALYPGVLYHSALSEVAP